MASTVEFLPGPLTSEMPRTAAEEALRSHPSIKKGATYALEQLEGRWVAAVVHEAAPPPFAGGGPADLNEEAPSPKSEGPDDAEPSEDKSDGPPVDADGDFDGDEGGEKKPKEKGEKGSGLEHQILDLLHQIGAALGLPLGGLGDSAVPGPDVPPPGPPMGPPGLDPRADKQVVRHERVTKPGETPPGGTPIGAPAFASVRNDHPWAHLAGKVASFEVAEKIGNVALAEIKPELDGLASEMGYRVSRLRDDVNDNGERLAVAVITKH